MTPCSMMPTAPGMGIGQFHKLCQSDAPSQLPGRISNSEDNCKAREDIEYQ